MANGHQRDRQIEEEEEYVLLDLDDCLCCNIQPNGGLDTLTPNLIVGGGVKMIGEYEEMVGTYYLFSESVDAFAVSMRFSDASPKQVHDHTAPPKVNKDKLGSTNKEGPSEEVKHLASVQKILKIRSINEDHEEHRAYQHKDKEFSFDPSNRM